MTVRGPADGMGVDSAGGPVVDPTANVISLVEAGMRRQDDLRNQETVHVREIMNLRAGHYADLRRAETARIDAIRAVDVAAVQQAAQVAADAATALAATLAATSEAGRNQVAAAAQAGVISLAAALEPIQKDVAELRKVQYQQAGERNQQVEYKADSRSDKSQVWVALAVSMSTLLGLASILITLTHHA